MFCYTYYREGNDPADSKIITYKMLLDDVCRLANILKDKGIKKGDTVALYMPMIPELAIAMLAVARIGAVHSIVVCLMFLYLFCTQYSISNPLDWLIK